MLFLFLFLFLFLLLFTFFMQVTEYNYKYQVDMNAFIRSASEFKRRMDSIVLNVLISLIGLCLIPEMIVVN